MTTSKKVTFKKLPEDYVKAGWCKGSAAQDRNRTTVDVDDQTAVAWCATGSVEAWMKDEEPCVHYASYLAKVVEVVCEQEGLVNDGVGYEWAFIQRWNDAAKRRKAEVVSVLSEASKRLGLVREKE
jgi:hypothetical protein